MDIYVGETKEIKTDFTPEYTGSAGIRWFEESYGIISVKRVNSLKTEVKGLKKGTDTVNVAIINKVGTTTVTVKERPEVKVNGKVVPKEKILWRINGAYAVAYYLCNDVYQLKSEKRNNWYDFAIDAKNGNLEYRGTISVSDRDVKIIIAEYDSTGKITKENIGNISVFENYVLVSSFERLMKTIGIGVSAAFPFVDIPQDERNLGTVMSYMGWHLVTSKSSPQYKLKENARNTNRYSISTPEYYAMVDNRIVIATKPNIGGLLEVSIGDYVDVTFQAKNDTMKTYNCIIGDFKGADAPNLWGHYDGKGVVEIIYHDYSPPNGYDKNVNNPWGVGNVLKITKVGNYYSGK